MKDKIEIVLQKVRETWGPLPVRDIDYACSCVRDALEEFVSDINIKQAVYSLLLSGLEKRHQFEQEFIGKETIEEILQLHIERQTALYLFTAYTFHPGEDFEDPQKIIEERYCKHMAMPSRKALYDEFPDAKKEAHELLCKVIDNLPPMMTNCELEIDIIDDNIGLIGMGTWSWDRLSSITTFRKPARQ